MRKTEKNKNIIMKLQVSCCVSRNGGGVVCACKELVTCNNGDGGGFLSASWDQICECNSSGLMAVGDSTCNQHPTNNRFSSTLAHLQLLRPQALHFQLHRVPYGWHRLIWLAPTHMAFQKPPGLLVHLILSWGLRRHESCE